MMRRRGGAMVFVLLLMTVLVVLVAQSLAVVGSTSASLERDYRRGQATALADAGLVMARLSVPTGRLSGARGLDTGNLTWHAALQPDGSWLVSSSGTVTLANGSTLTQRVVQRLVRREGNWTSLTRTEESQP